MVFVFLWVQRNLHGFIELNYELDNFLPKPLNVVSDISQGAVVDMRGAAEIKDVMIQGDDSLSQLDFSMGFGEILPLSPNNNVSRSAKQVTVSEPSTEKNNADEKLSNEGSNEKLKSGDVAFKDLGKYQDIKNDEIELSKEQCCGARKYPGYLACCGPQCMRFSCEKMQMDRKLLHPLPPEQPFAQAGVRDAKALEEENKKKAYLAEMIKSGKLQIPDPRKVALENGISKLKDGPDIVEAKTDVQYPPPSPYSGGSGFGAANGWVPYFQTPVGPSNRGTSVAIPFVMPGGDFGTNFPSNSKATFIQE